MAQAHIVVAAMTPGRAAMTPGRPTTHLRSAHFSPLASQPSSPPGSGYTSVQGSAPASPFRKAAAATVAAIADVTTEARSPLKSIGAQEGNDRPGKPLAARSLAMSPLRSMTPLTAAAAEVVTVTTPEVGRCRLTRGRPQVHRAWFQLLKQKCGEQVSNFAFNFNLRATQRRSCGSGCGSPCTRSSGCAVGRCS